MQKMKNETHIEGYLYSHDLTMKTTGQNSKNPGTEFISGNVNIATDDAMLNVVPVHFTYVTAKTSTGKSSATFEALNNIVNGTYKNALENGVDQAVKLRIDSAIGLNEFYSDRNGVEELVSAKRNEGGFIHVAPSISDDEKTRNTFKCDMIITGVRHVEGDPEKNTEDKAIVKGCIFDFRNSILPVEFSATSAGAMNYFESLEAGPKSPVFTQVWGRQVSETVTRKIVQESAFGEDSIREIPQNRKDWVITGANKEIYSWDDESTITVAELTSAMAARETYLATIKQRQDEYKASKSNTVAPAAAGGFNF